MNPQNESPFSNPKFLIAIVVTFLGLWGWQYYMNKAYPPALVSEKSQTPQDSKAQLPPVIAKAPAPAQPPPAASEKTETFSYEDENVRWTMSSDGMGLKNFELKKYKDRGNKQVEFVSSENLFNLYVNNNKLRAQITKISDTEYLGEAIVDGKKISRKLTFNPQKTYFDSVITFEPGLQSVLITLDSKKLVVDGGSFFMPSFERQDFLFSEKDKITAEPISSLADSEVFNKQVSAVGLASIGTQYFTTTVIDKSEMTPAYICWFKLKQRKPRLFTVWPIPKLKN